MIVKICVINIIILLLIINKSRYSLYSWLQVSEASESYMGHLVDIQTALKPLKKIEKID